MKFKLFTLVSLFVWFNGSTALSEPQPDPSGEQMEFFLLEESPYDFATTVDNLADAISAAGWLTPKIYNLQKSMSDHGYTVLPVKVFEVCKPEYAARMLAADEYRFVSSMMPCRISVYKQSDGKTYLSRMNTGMMAAMFGGELGDIMQLASDETTAIVQSALE